MCATTLHLILLIVCYIIYFYIKSASVLNLVLQPAIMAKVLSGDVDFSESAGQLVSRIPTYIEYRSSVPVWQRTVTSIKSNKDAIKMMISISRIALFFCRICDIDFLIGHAPRVSTLKYVAAHFMLVLAGWACTGIWHVSRSERLDPQDAAAGSSQPTKRCTGQYQTPAASADQWGCDTMRAVLTLQRSWGACVLQFANHWLSSSMETRTQTPCLTHTTVYRHRQSARVRDMRDKDNYR